MRVTVLLADDSTTIRRYARSILEEGDDEPEGEKCEPPDTVRAKLL